MNSKEQIRQAIESLGVSVPSNTPLSQYPAKIRQRAWRAHDNLINICSNPANTSYFPYNRCGGRNSNIITWEGTSCPLASGTATIYGNARCSTQKDVVGWGCGGGVSSASSLICSGSDNYRPIFSYEPTNDAGSGANCWCQLCTSNSRVSCGGWVFQRAFDLASTCSGNCADFCAFYCSTYPAYRIALCAPPES